MTEDGADDVAAAYEDAACGLLTTTMDGVVLRVNRTLLRWTGFQAADVVGRRLLDLLTPGGRAYHETHFMPLLRLHGTAYEIALDISTADGGRIPTLINAHTVPGADGRPGRIRVAIFRAAQRREYERALLEANQQKEHALEEAQDAQGALMREQARVALIADASEALLSTMQPAAAIDRMLEVIVEHVALWSTVFMVVDDEPIRFFLKHRDPDRVARVADHLTEPRALLANMPLTREVIEGRRRAIVTTAEESHRAGTLTGASAAIFRELGTGPAIIVPLGDDTVVGALAIVGPPERAAFDVVDVALARDLAHRASMTLRHARAFERERINAQELQRSLLPQLPQLSDLTADTAYVAASAGAEIGGDWYDLLQIDDRIVASIGDVTGHSLAAAATMARVQAVLQISAREGLDPAAMLERANHNARSLLADRQASCQILQLTRSSTDGWIGDLSSAGHPFPVLVGPDGAARLLEPAIDPLLGLGIEPPRRNTRFRIAAGSIVILYTDGLIEHRGRSLDDGYVALAEAAEREARHGIEGIASRVIDRLDPSGHDDIACLALYLH